MAQNTFEIRVCVHIFPTTKSEGRRNYVYIKKYVAENVTVMKLQSLNNIYQKAKQTLSTVSSDYFACAQSNGRK